MNKKHKKRSIHIDGEEWKYTFGHRLYIGSNDQPYRSSVIRIWSPFGQMYSPDLEFVQQYSNTLVKYCKTCSKPTWEPDIHDGCGLCNKSVGPGAIKKYIETKILCK